MNLITWKRAGDGTIRQVTIPILEADMKLKCTFCVERHGNAVKTDQLVLIATATGDKLACIKCADRIKGRNSHEQSNDDVKRN